MFTSCLNATVHLYLIFILYLCSLLHEKWLIGAWLAGGVFLCLNKISVDLWLDLSFSFYVVNIYLYQICKTTGWIAMDFWTNIHVPQRINPTDFSCGATSRLTFWFSSEMSCQLDDDFALDCYVNWCRHSQTLEIPWLFI